MSEGWGVGDQAGSEAFGTALVGKNEVELIFGEHPHSRRDDRIYARTKGGSIYDFDGHRILVDVQITSGNYLKSSGLSGDEIRRSVAGAIFADGVQVYEFSHREPGPALLQAHRLLSRLWEHPVHWLDKRNRELLPGRQIYFHQQPAVIDHIVESRGCVVIRTGAGYTPPPWSNWLDPGEQDVLEDVLSPSIYWWRDA